MERKLNEQWVLEINGVKHMVKAVEGICIDCFLENGSRCTRSDECPAGDQGNYIIKDLGILNEDGCLPSPWGGYPKIIHEVDQDRTESGEDVHYDNLWCVEIHKPVLICTDEYPTKQEAIDAWNRRA